MANPLVHVEINVKDAQKAAKWYADVFGWQTSYDANLNYGQFSTGDQQVGGGFNPPREGNFMPGSVPYIGTDDIPGMLKKVEAAGGKVLMQEERIPGMGTFGLCMDPDGNVIGFYNGTPE
jgi:predicted enzyme related to lactoylglutathione lyase